MREVPVEMCVHLLLARLAVEEAQPALLALKPQATIEERQRLGSPSDARKEHKETIISEKASTKVELRGRDALEDVVVGQTNIKSEQGVVVLLDEHVGNNYRRHYGYWDHGLDLFLLDRSKEVLEGTASTEPLKLREQAEIDSLERPGTRVGRWRRCRCGSRTEGGNGGRDDGRGAQASVRSGGDVLARRRREGWLQGAWLGFDHEFGFRVLRSKRCELPSDLVNLVGGELSVEYKVFKLFERGNVRTASSNRVAQRMTRLLQRVDLTVVDFIFGTEERLVLSQLQQASNVEQNARSLTSRCGRGKLLHLSGP